MRNSIRYFGLAAILILSACSVTDDTRDNPLDPKYGSTGSGTGTTTAATNKADLVISTFTTAASYTNNTTYSFSVTVKNQGTVAASSFIVGVTTDFSSSGLNWAFPYQGSFAGRTTVASLAAGASTTVSVSFKPLFTSHSLIGAYADTAELISESNENNNHQINIVTIN